MKNLFWLLALLFAAPAFSQTPHYLPCTGPAGAAGCTVVGPIASSGNITGKSVSNIFQATQFPAGTSYAEQVTSCLTAAGAGGTCDARGLTGVLPWDELVTPGTPCNGGSGQAAILLMNPAASIEPTTATTGIFKMNCNVQVLGAHIVIPPALNYTGTAVTVSDTITSNNVNSFSLDGLSIDASTYSAGGYGLYISPPAGSYIQLTTFHNIKINGLLNSLYLYTTGTTNTYLNGNNFSDLVIQGNGKLITLNNAAGSIQIAGNTFSNVQTDGTGCAIVFAGVHVDSNTFNALKIFDTASPMCNIATGAFANLFVGNSDNPVTDPAANNNAIAPFQDVWIMGGVPWSTFNTTGVNIGGPDAWTNAINYSSFGWNGLGTGNAENDYDQNVYTGLLYSHAFRAANSAGTGRNVLGGFGPGGIWYAGALAGTAGTPGTTATSFTLGGATVVGSGATAACASGVLCDEISGNVQLVTGTGTSANGQALTINLGTTRTHIASCTYYVENASLGASAPTTFFQNPTTTAIVVYAGSILTASNTWQISYVCGGG
jgi:hypothetical protein